MPPHGPVRPGRTEAEARGLPASRQPTSGLVPAPTGNWQPQATHRPGVAGLPGEAGGHTRFGAIVTPGGGRKTHSPFPGALAEIVTTSVSSAVFANHVEINNGLSYLNGAGWRSYTVAELPGPFRAALWVWIDLSWTDAQPGTEIPLEVIVELVTPIKTATFSEMKSVIITPAERTGFDRVSFAFSLAGTLHETGLHVLNVSCNTGARLGQYLNVGIKPSPKEPTLSPRPSPCTHLVGAVLPTAPFTPAISAARSLVSPVTTACQGPRRAVVRFR